MTEDILFDNIYVGHSPEDAKVFALETFEVKKPLEVALDKPTVADDDEDESISFKDDPINFIRTRVLAFIEAAKVDPLQAFKTQPETGAALAGALFTLFGMLGALVSIIGGAQKPVVTKVILSSLFLKNATFTLFLVCQEGRTFREKVGSRTRFLRYRLQERRWLEEAQCQVNGYCNLLRMKRMDGALLDRSCLCIPWFCDIAALRGPAHIEPSLSVGIVVGIVATTQKQIVCMAI
jgi:hypothetical protein